SKWVVRLGWTGSQPSHPFGEYVAKTLGYKKVAVFGTDYAFGYEVVGGFQRSLEEAGGVFTDRVLSFDPASMRWETAIDGPGGATEMVQTGAFLTPRPESTSGITISGMAPSTNIDSRGLVMIIITVAPAKSSRLRSAIEAEAPKADWILVVSADRRETISPALVRSKKAASSVVRWRKTSCLTEATMRSPSVMTR
ncbi:MAG: ABC transporter substrate-binding protein, partial [Sphingopyxis sp.]|nr:ABC transporter substrate-binding protein [Sphingopyxis sp.]